MVELICLIFLSCTIEPLYLELGDLDRGACYQGESYHASFHICSEGYQSLDISDILED